MRKGQLPGSAFHISDSADNMITGSGKFLSKGRADKTCAANDQNSFPGFFIHSGNVLLSKEVFGKQISRILLLRQQYLIFPFHRLQGHKARKRHERNTLQVLIVLLAESYQHFFFFNNFYIRGPEYEAKNHA